MGKVAEAAACWRQAPDEAARQRAREGLAAAIRERVARRIAPFRVLGAAQGDVIQEATLKVLHLIEQGEAREGTEDGFAAACAFTMAGDWLRRNPPGQIVSFDPDDREGPSADATAETVEQVMIASHEDKRDRALGDAALRLIEHAPANYRWALTAVYVEGESIDDLVRKELHKRSRSGEAQDPPDEVDFKRARQSVDQWLCRGRAWLRANLVRHDDGEVS